MNRSYLLVPRLLVVLVACIVLRSPGVITVNQSATLKGELTINPLKWRVITCGTNPRESTMSTLFGNDIAVEYSRRHGEGHYPPGSMLALVTWQQQEDDRWFGARMPGQTKSMETVAIPMSEGGQPSYSYQEYKGSPLMKTQSNEARANARAVYLLSLRAAVMP